MHHGQSTKFHYQNHPTWIVYREETTTSLLWNTIIPPGQAELDKELIAFNRLKYKAEKRKSKARKHKNKWEPKIGDLVLVRDHKLSNMLKGKYYKMELLYKGPLVITEILGNHTYELENNSSRKIEGRFHKQMLKPYKGNPI